MGYAQDLLALAREVGKDTLNWEMVDLLAWAHDEIADYDEKKDKGTQKEKIKTLLHDRALVVYPGAGSTKEDLKSSTTSEQQKSIPTKIEKRKDKTIRETMKQKAEDQAEIDEETGGKIRKEQAEEDADKLIKRG